MKIITSVAQMSSPVGLGERTRPRMLAMAPLPSRTLQLGFRGGHIQRLSARAETGTRGRVRSPETPSIPNDYEDE